MNVNEKILKEKIDPYLTAHNLSVICSESLGKTVDVEKAYILTGGCLNRVIGLILPENCHLWICWVWPMTIFIVCMGKYTNLMIPFLSVRISIISK
jgi:hypothetical protein